MACGTGRGRSGHIVDGSTEPTGRSVRYAVAAAAVPAKKLGPAMDIKARIEAAPMKRTQVGVIAICMALYMIDGFDVLVMAFSANAVMEDWGLSASQLGVLLSSALVGMAIGSIFVSSVADVIGRQKTLVIGAAIVAVGMLVSAFAPGYGVLVVLRF